MPTRRKNPRCLVGWRPTRPPLAFVLAGGYTTRIWRDATEAETDPNRLELETRTPSSTDTICRRLARVGGFVAQLRPAGK